VAARVEIKLCAGIWCWYIHPRGPTLRANDTRTFLHFFPSGRAWFRARALLGWLAVSAPFLTLVPALSTTQTPFALDQSLRIVWAQHVYQSPPVPGASSTAGHPTSPIRRTIMHSGALAATQGAYACAGRVPRPAT
jgi:hypothetical protein